MKRTLAALCVLVVVAFYVGQSTVRTNPDVQVVWAATPSAAQKASEDYGAKQAAVHLALKRTAPIVPLLATFSVGSSGPGVRQLQRALAKAKFRKGKATGHYGTATAKQVAKFQKAKKVKPVTGQYGPKTHHYLSQFYDLTSRRILQAVAHERAQNAKYVRVTHGTSYAWLHRTSMAYSQSASRQFLPSLPGFPRATDCSGYVTWVYKVSGIPDPNGFNFAPVGYTGTLALHGTRVSANDAMHVGDLVFYGGGYPYGHVAIVVDAFKRTVSSHGSPGIKVVPFNYRPVSAVRRYF